MRLLLQAEVLELRATQDGRASGVVIESSLDKGRGPVATVLVQQGMLKKGDYLVCGVQYGRVRALFDENGEQVPRRVRRFRCRCSACRACPMPATTSSWSRTSAWPRTSRSSATHKRRESRLVKQAGNRMEDIMAQMGKGEGQLSLNLVIKADVQGSVEALRESLTALSNDQIRINVIVSGVGGITESDANSAAARKATIIGFNVRADASARRVVDANKLDLRYFSIIYDVIDQVKQVASGMLGVEIREEIIGTAEVRDVFRRSKFGAVAGCMVIEGVVKRHKPIRVLRDNAVIFEGELESLRRFKENVDEVRNGTECGIGVKQYNDVQAGRPDRVLRAHRSASATLVESDAMAQKSFHRTDRVSAAAPPRAGHAGARRGAGARPAVGQRVRCRGHARHGARQGVRDRVAGRTCR